MELTELIIEAISTLTVNKLRTGLAMLGIIIGIGSVIALISLGQSSQQAIKNQIENLGSNLLTVMPRGRLSGGVRLAMSASSTLTLEDAQAIENKKSSLYVQTVSPEFSSRTQVVAGRNNTNTQVYGVTNAYQTVHKVTMQSGSFISDLDDTSMSKVAVLGPQVVTDLFGEGSDPIGQSVRLSGQSFRVIGVTTSKGGTGFNNADDMIYIPLSTAQKQIFGSKYLGGIGLAATSEKDMVAAQDAVGYLLLERHKISLPANADFSIFSQKDILDTSSQITGTFTALLGGIAAISLLVGGIGIMNIMLVTVTERTREIGLRKALGAKKSMITKQFLIESSLLTLFGGVVGMLVGVGTSYVLAKVLSTPFVFSPSSVALAMGVSGLIGIVFGWYPARQAANMQPIEALRYE